MKKILSVMYYAFIALNLALILWFVASWFDIIADNTKPNPQHYDWNFFVVAYENRVNQ